MKWLDKWFYKQTKRAWENKNQYEQDEYSNSKAIRMNTLSSGAMVERGRAEGENRISFELSNAVGGKILNVRRYDDRKDRQDSQTYVIPSGEDVGSRVAKIVNLELIKG